MPNGQPADHVGSGDDRDQLLTRIAVLQALLAAGQRDIDSLHRALDTSRRIGAAMGIVKAAWKISEDDAFEVLRLESQSTNRKLRDVADEVVLTGVAPYRRPGA